jgi:S-adenosylmethionine hydrolase
MKGVLLGLAPQARVIDLTHEIPPGNIRAGAFALATSYSFFSRNTIHVAVVDPGVGSNRPAIAAKTSRYIFVGPDNGLLSWAVARERNVVVHRIENQQYFLKEISSTFHGRDIFAPVAAHLSRGVQISRLGPRVGDYVRLDWPQIRVTDQGVEGEVLYIDHFGNGITNILSADVRAIQKEQPSVFVRRKRICEITAFYQAVPPIHPVAVIGSSGFLELAVNGGSAAQRLRLSVGTKVTVR